MKMHLDATPDQINAAASSAAAAFSQTRTTSGAERATLLEAIAREIEGLGEALLTTAHAETALPMARLTGERARTLNQIRIFAAMAREGSWVCARIDKGAPERKPLPKPDVRAMLLPVGPVVVFGASNFPLAISVAGTDTICALAAGCPVLVKAHPGHPETSRMVAGAISSAVKSCNLPAGTFSMLYGASHEVGLALVRHPAVTAVAFTGSEKGGRALFDAANARPIPIPVFAEMGSINPVFILPEALAARPEALANTFVQSLTMGVGQFCTNPGLVVVCEGPGLDQFSKALDAAVTAVAPAPMLNAGILGSFESGVAGLEESQGVQRLAKSGAAAAQASCSVFETTAKVFGDTPKLAHEVFGPTSLLVRCASSVEMLNVAANLKGQLTASVHSHGSDLSRFGNLLQTLEQKVGRIVFDGFATGIEVCAAMNHGGPYPASTNAQFTSIGHASIYRFVRPVAYQNTPEAALPLELRDSNPLGIRRLENETLI
jgi:2,5-dioxopentanoate dehydrogenase